MQRMIFAVLLFFLAMVPAKAQEGFQCVPTDMLLRELALIQPSPMIGRLETALIPGFISGMKELANIPPPLPAAKITGLILVAATNTNTMVVLYEVNDMVCAAIKIDKRMGVDILNRGSEA